VDGVPRLSPPAFIGEERKSKRDRMDHTLILFAASDLVKKGHKIGGTSAGRRLGSGSSKKHQNNPVARQGTGNY